MPNKKLKLIWISVIPKQDRLVFVRDKIKTIKALVESSPELADWLAIEAELTCEACSNQRSL